MNIKEARLKTGLTQKAMSELMEIPKRTIEDWENERRNPPAYVERLVINELKRIAEEKEKMKKIRLVKATVEVKAKDASKITTGITHTYKDDVFEGTLMEFDTQEEANAEINKEKYKPEVIEYSGYYLINEYFIEELEWDEKYEEWEHMSYDTPYDL